MSSAHFSPTSHLVLDEAELLLEGRCPDGVVDVVLEIGLSVWVPLGQTVGQAAVANCIGAESALPLQVGDDAGRLGWGPALVDEIVHRLADPWGHGGGGGVR